MRVGWIGLGAMGAPMALSAIRGGHVLHGYARRPHAHDALREAGAAISDVLEAAVREAALVCVNLFSEAQVREVVLEGGALAAMPPGAILAIHSTVAPVFVRELGAVRPDIGVLDAGFSGGAEEALSGRLTLMVGGEVGLLERARPVFSTYAGHMVHAGPIGAGMALKVLNNLMFGAHVALARDALRLARSAGLSTDVTIGALMRGSGGSNALALLGRGGDPEAMLPAIRPYLDKDVPIARDASRGLDLGMLDAATREYG